MYRISIMGKNKGKLVPIVTVLSKIIAANVEWDDKFTDVTDFILANLQVIAVIVGEHLTAKAIRKQISYFKKAPYTGTMAKRMGFIFVSGAATAAVTSLIVYPLDLTRINRREAKKAIKQRQEEEKKEGKETTEKKSTPTTFSFGGLFKTFAVNILPCSVDIAFNYGRDHATTALLILATASFTGLQYAVTGGIRRATKFLIPTAYA